MSTSLNIYFMFVIRISCSQNLKAYIIESFVIRKINFILQFYTHDIYYTYIPSPTLYI